MSTIIRNGVIIDTDPEWNNPQRTRYYGLRIGDVVTREFVPELLKGVEYTVVRFCLGDNNGVIVKDNQTGQEVKVVAEHCNIVRKIEDQK